MSTILAVDDSATMRKCLEITFAGTDMNLVTCDNANAALEQVKSLGPDLVIADASLTPTDGYELCSTIKGTAPHIPVLMLSSKQHPFDAGKGAQADDHIDKPFDTQVLQDRARQLLAAGPKVAAEAAAAPAAETQIGAPAPPPAGQRPAAPAAAAGGKIPAPRRRRPTPAMMPTPQPGQKAQAPAAGGRRPVPFAMPSTLKKGPSAPSAGAGDTPRKGTAQPTMAFGSRPQAPAETPPEVSPEPPTPKPAETAPTPAAPPVEAAPAPAAAAIPAPVAADLESKLTGLGLNQQQVEGVLALSREVVEQVVWEVVPDLAETLIKEEIARLTKE